MCRHAKDDDDRHVSEAFVSHLLTTELFAVLSRHPPVGEHQTINKAGQASVG